MQHWNKGKFYNQTWGFSKDNQIGCFQINFNSWDFLFSTTFATKITFTLGPIYFNLATGFCGIQHTRFKKPSILKWVKICFSLHNKLPSLTFICTTFYFCSEMGFQLWIYILKTHTDRWMYKIHFRPIVVNYFCLDPRNSLTKRVQRVTRHLV